MRAAVFASFVGAAVATYSNTTSHVEEPHYTTKIVTSYTTYCPEPTEIPVGNSTITVTEPTHITITDCPCTITEPVEPTKEPEHPEEPETPEEPEHPEEPEVPEEPEMPEEPTHPEEPTPAPTAGAATIAPLGALFAVGVAALL